MKKVSLICEQKHCVSIWLPQQQMENIDAERDIYDELLTQAEIQGNVNKVNGKPSEHRPILDSLICMHRLAVTFNCLLCSGKCN